MNLAQIITISLNAVNILNCLFWMIMFSKKTKSLDNSKENFAQIIKNIPTYIQDAKNIFGSNTLAITNYVLAMLNRDCNNMNVKYQEKQLKKEIEKKMEEV